MCAGDDTHTFDTNKGCLALPWTDISAGWMGKRQLRAIPVCCVCTYPDMAMHTGLEESGLIVV
jgi:hypothetical protein